MVRMGCTWLWGCHCSLYHEATVMGGQSLHQVAVERIELGLLFTALHCHHHNLPLLLTLQTQLKHFLERILVILSMHTQKAKHLFGRCRNSLRINTQTQTCTDKSMCIQCTSTHTHTRTHTHTEHACAFAFLKSVFFFFSSACGQHQFSHTW